MAYYARKCDEHGEDLVGGDNCLWLDGRLSLRTMQRRASEWARESKAPGYNIYRNLRDPRPLIQHIYIMSHPSITFRITKQGRGAFHFTTVGNTYSGIIVPAGTELGTLVPGGPYRDGDIAYADTIIFTCDDGRVLDALVDNHKGEYEVVTE